MVLKEEGKRSAHKVTEHIRSQNRKGPEPMRPEANAGGVGEHQAEKGRQETTCEEPEMLWWGIYISVPETILLYLASSTKWHAWRWVSWLCN